MGVHCDNDDDYGDDNDADNDFDEYSHEWVYSAMWRMSRCLSW